MEGCGRKSMQCKNSGDDVVTGTRLDRVAPVWDVSASASVIKLHLLSSTCTIKPRIWLTRVVLDSFVTLGAFHCA